MSFLILVIRVYMLTSLIYRFLIFVATRVYHFKSLSNIFKSLYSLWGALYSLAGLCIVFWSFVYPSGGFV